MQQMMVHLTDQTPGQAQQPEVCDARAQLLLRSLHTLHLSTWYGHQVAESSLPHPQSLQSHLRCPAAGERAAEGEGGSCHWPGLAKGHRHSGADLLVLRAVAATPGLGMSLQDSKYPGEGTVNAQRVFSTAEVSSASILVSDIQLCKLPRAQGKDHVWLISICTNL